MNEEELINEVLGEPPLAPQHSVSSGIDEGFPRTSISKPRTVKNAIPRRLGNSPIYQKRLEEEEEKKKQINAEIEEFRKKSKVDREEREKVRAKWRETLYHGGERKKNTKKYKRQKRNTKKRRNTKNKRKPKGKRKQRSTKKR